MPQSTLYGIWFHKNTVYDKSDQPNVLEWEGIVVSGNVVNGVEYPYVLHEETETASPPLRFTDVVLQGNKAINGSSSTGLANYPLYSNIQLDKYLGIDNSWNHLDVSGGPPPNPGGTQVLYGQGEVVHNNVITEFGGAGSKFVPIGYVFSGPALSTWHQMRTLTGN
jgi:hypothetical protein